MWFQDKNRGREPKINLVSIFTQSENEYYSISDFISEMLRLSDLTSLLCKVSVMVSVLLVSVHTV